MTVGVTAAIEIGQRRLDLAALVEAALGEPGVVADAEALERGPHLLQHQLDPAAADGLAVGGVDALGGDPPPQLDDVLAFVAVRRQLGAGHTGDDRVGEAVDLAAAVVDVVLALDLVADRLQQADEGVAIGRVAAAADVQRPGRVGGDELDQDPLRVGGRGRAEILADGDQRRQRPPEPGVGEEEVDEAGAGDLDPVEAAAAPSSRSSSAWRRAATARGLSPRGAASSIAALEL